MIAQGTSSNFDLNQPGIPFLNNRLICSFRLSFTASNLSYLWAVTVWKRAACTAASAAAPSIGATAGKSGVRYARYATHAFLFGSSGKFQAYLLSLIGVPLTTGRVLHEAGDCKSDPLGLRDCSWRFLWWLQAKFDRILAHRLVDEIARGSLVVILVSDVFLAQSLNARLSSCNNWMIVIFIIELLITDSTLSQFWVETKNY